MIIIEGFDASGKTTLAQQISAAYKWPVYHTGGPTASVIDVQRCLNRSLVRARHECIQDRVTHVSEAVYSMTEHPRKAALALSSIVDLPRDVAFIYCRPSTKFLRQALHETHVRERWDTPKHMDRLLKDADMMISFYDTVIAIVERYISVHKYDRTLPDAVPAVFDYLSRRLK